MAFWSNWFTPNLPTLGPPSPWTPGLPPSVAVQDIWGDLPPEAFPASDEQFMRSAPFKGARDIIVRRLAGGTLVAYRGPDALDPQPSWLTRTDGEMSPTLRTLHTAHDLLLHGFALWAVERGVDGLPLVGQYLPRAVWSFDQHGKILVQGNEVDQSQVILFLGQDAGLLTTAASTIRQSEAIDRAVTTRVRNPVATTIISESAANPFEDEEAIQQYVSAFASARRATSTGSVIFKPAEIESIQEFGVGDIALYEQARNALTLDVARVTGVPASLLGASGTSASLTYSTTAEARNMLLDVLHDHAQAIESRLSMDDCVPRGQSVRLDLSHLVGGDTGESAIKED